MTNVEKAVGLSRLDIHVFPFRVTDDGGKAPLTGHGHLDAVTDEAQIRAWWKRWPDAEVGVAAGASSLLCADVDEKNGLSGSRSLQEAWLDLPKTWEHLTPTGGTHRVYEAPAGVRLAPSTNFDGLEGIDVRAGSSWFGWWSDEVPESRDEFSDAPEWLCRPAKDVVGGAFEGGLDEWLESLDEAEGEPSGKVLDAIQRIPTDDFGHDILIERQFEFVRLGAEGHPGVRHGLDILRSEWLRGQYDTDDNRYEFDLGLSGAIAKAGDLEAAIKALPDYGKTIDKFMAAGLDPDSVFGAKPKPHYFKLIRLLVSFDAGDEEVATVIWNGPAVKEWAREFGIDYLYERIAEERALLNEPPEQSAEPGQPVTDSDAPVSLLAPEERRLVDATPGFIDRYLAWARSMLPKINEPYHRAGAWTILALSHGGTAFVPAEGKKFPVNFYSFILGESSTGKSDMMLLQMSVLREMFKDDFGWHFSKSTSPASLHEGLIERDGMSAWFEVDEVASLLSETNRVGSWMSTMNTDLTNYHGGFIPPVSKKNAKEVSGKEALVALSVQLMGTPDRTMQFMDESMILDGFLARMMWTFGESKAGSAKRRIGQRREVMDDAEDPIAVAFGNEMRNIPRGRKPVLGTDAAIERMNAGLSDIHDILVGDPLWHLMESPYARMTDQLHKCAALHALGRRAREFDTVDVLHVLEQAEIWVRGLLKAVRMLSGSVFSRDVDKLAMAVKSAGSLSEAKLYSRFSKWDYLREFTPRLEAAKARGLVRARTEAGKSVYEWSGVDESRDGV